MPIRPRSRRDRAARGPRGLRRRSRIAGRAHSGAPRDGSGRRDDESAGRAAAPAAGERRLVASQRVGGRADRASRAGAVAAAALVDGYRRGQFAPRAHPERAGRGGRADLRDRRRGTAFGGRDQRRGGLAEEPRSGEPGRGFRPRRRARGGSGRALRHDRIRRGDGAAALGRRGDLAPELRRADPRRSDRRGRTGLSGRAQRHGLRARSAERRDALAGAGVRRAGPARRRDGGDRRADRGHAFRVRRGSGDPGAQRAPGLGHGGDRRSPRTGAQPDQRHQRRSGLRRLA